MSQSSEDRTKEASASELSRRRFLKILAAGSAAAAFSPLAVLAAHQAAIDVENPLKHYPDRGWEKVYLDQYRCDRTFTWICAPNDTHMCRMRAFARNGVMGSRPSSPELPS